MTNKPNCGKLINLAIGINYRFLYVWKDENKIQRKRREKARINKETVDGNNHLIVDLQDLHVVEEEDDQAVAVDGA